MHVRLQFLEEVGTGAIIHLIFVGKNRSILLSRALAGRLVLDLSTGPVLDLRKPIPFQGCFLLLARLE
jgi:hypothetical protein